MLSFSFGGKNSFNDYGILMTMKPTIPSPTRRVTTLNVPGRNSTLRFDENTYEDITIAVHCSVKDNSNLADKVDLIKGWLVGTGESDLIFNFQEDKKYIAQVVNAIDYAQILKMFSRFIIIFNCRPFKYSVDNPKTSLISAANIKNIGSLYSEPTIKIYGSGDGTLTIGSQVITLSGIVNGMIIDSNIQDCYGEDRSNLNNKMAGEFPILNVGLNNISWTGGITGVDITPNWRWL